MSGAFARINWAVRSSFWVMGLTGNAVAQVLHSRAIMRLELAFAAFNLAEYGVWVSVLVYAYGRGGTTGAALVATAQLLPAAALAQGLARILRRGGPIRYLRRGYALETVSLTLLGVTLIASAPAALVYAAAVVAAVAVTSTRPAQSTLLPLIVSGTDRLTAVNAVSGLVESACVLAGPALAGLMITVGGPGAAVCLFAGCTAVSAAVCPTQTARSAARAGAGPVAAPLGTRHAAEATNTSGVGADSSGAPAWPVVWTIAAEYTVVGMIDVLAVVLAIRVLTLGPAGAAYLTAAFGAGGAMGAAVSAGLIGRASLSTLLLAATASWAGLMAALGTTATASVAFLLIAGAGSARTVLDVSGRTILMRSMAVGPAHLFARLEAFTMFGLALGSLCVPVLASVGGAQTALEGAAALLVITAVVTAPHLRPRAVVPDARLVAPRVQWNRQEIL